MKSQKQYKAFISYSHADAKIAGWLHRELESYRTPRWLRGAGKKTGTAAVRLGPIFRDRDDLASAHDLSESIRNALQSSANLIVICSPQAARSRWVDQEIEEFKKLGRSDHIFCLIVAGTPDPEDKENDCFPPSLRTLYGPSGEKLEGVAEPVAADIRNHADGKKLARQKLIAGLLDVGLDDLRRRELQRRNRRLAAFTAASLLLSAVTVTLAINATLARREAEVARNEAEQRRTQAEELLGFMVGDLRNSLEPIGKLDILESVVQQAMDYFATVDVHSLSDKELSRQAQVMTQLGEIRFSQLRHEQALDSFTQAFERSAELYNKSPADPDRLFNRSQAEFWVGYVAWESGNLAEAKKWMLRYGNSARALVALAPDRTDFKMEVIFSIHNLAAIEMENRNYLAAKRAFQQEIQLYEEVITADVEPELEVELLTSQADAYSWMGDISFQLGELNEARSYFHICSGNFRNIYERDKSVANSADYLGVSLLQQARIERFLGNMEHASALSREANQLFNSLVERDKTNTDWRVSQLRTEISLGYLAAGKGAWPETDAVAKSSILQFEKLLDSGKSDHEVHSALAEAYQLHAWSLQQKGQYENALQAAQAGIDRLRSVERLTSLNDTRLGLLASLLVLQGQIHITNENHEFAKSALQESTLLLSDRVKDSNSPSLLDPWARLLIAKGQAMDADTVLATLSQRHYQPLRPWPD